MTGVVEFEIPGQRDRRVSQDSPLPVTIVGGGGGGDSAAIGQPTDPAWNGSDASASLISIMKAIFAQQTAVLMEVSEIDQDMSVVRALLEDIKTNTASG